MARVGARERGADVTSSGMRRPRALGHGARRGRDIGRGRRGEGGGVQYGVQLIIAVIDFLSEKGFLGVGCYVVSTWPACVRCSDPPWALPPEAWAENISLFSGGAAAVHRGPPTFLRVPDLSASFNYPLIDLRSPSYRTDRTSPLQLLAAFHALRGGSGVWPRGLHAHPRAQRAQRYATASHSSVFSPWEAARSTRVRASGLGASSEPRLPLNGSPSTN